ncbi:uncharacterized protein [Chanodichthys erythropterus]|uniref:uncharacterized protein n=1 Tax=Chanodichthys erythropterus TaxID=933992 RepID=UPI00351EE1A7
MALLQVHQAKALRDLHEGGHDPQVLQELRAATDLALRATKVTARSGTITSRNHSSRIHGSWQTPGKQLGTLRQDETITDLVVKTKQYAERYDLKPPHPVCSSKTTAHFRYTQEEDANDQECSEVEVYPNVWKREMFEALDLVCSEVERRFDQVRIQVAAGREQIIEAAQGKKNYVTSLKLTGFTRERLSHELDILWDICTGREVNTIRDVVPILQTTQPQTRSMLSEVEKLIKLCLCLPISVAASERSFWTLRRLKTWLRNTMSQERLTHLAIMDAHSDLLDEIDVSTLIKKCTSRTTERRSTFGNA